METKSLPQPSGVHNCFNTLHRLASPVGFSLTVIVARSRIYANIGHSFSINFDVDLIDAIPQIFIVFRGDIAIFPKAFFSRRGLLLNCAAYRRSGFGRTYCPAARRKNEWCSKGDTHHLASKMAPKPALAIHSGHSDVRKHNIGMNELQLFRPP